MYPGHLAFYEMVAFPPEFLEASADAVVAIGISSAPRGKAERVVERGVTREGLQVQYGGPRPYVGGGITGSYWTFGVGLAPRY